MIDDVPLRLEVLTALYLDRESVAKGVNQRLLHGGYCVAVALYLHRVPNAQRLLLNLEQLASREILQDERVPHAQRLAVNLARLFAGLVLDPKVVPEGE